MNAGAATADPIKHVIVLMMENRALSGPARTDTPGELPMSTPVANLAPPIPPTTPSSHQSALFALSHSLESMTDVDPNVVAARSRHVLTGPQSMIHVSVDRVEDFLSQQRDRFAKELSRS